MARVEQSNTSAVDVGSSLGDVVVAPSLNNVANNDWIVLTAHFHGTKGGTAGSTIVKLYQKSGSASFQWLLNSGDVYGWMLPSVPANALHVGFLTYLLRCKPAEAGNVVFAVQAQSAGSVTSVDVGGCTIAAEQL